jgi:hypothetical protein
MVSLVQIIAAGGIFLSGLGAVFVGLAWMRIGEAWKIWAGRCDPKNPSFRPPLISRRP